MVMEVVYRTLMIGFIIGALAKYFNRSMTIGDIFSSMTMGLVGAVLFGWLGSVVKLYEYGNLIGLVASTIGAIIMVFIYSYYYRKDRASKK